MLGPGLRPGLATTELIRLLLAVPRDARAGRRSCSTPRRCARWPAVDGWWDASPARPCVLTPHAGEFARLRAGSGIDPAPTATSSTTTTRAPRPQRTPRETWGQVVVLKGARTVIAAPGRRAWRSRRSRTRRWRPAGTGDVLAGVIGALLAQGLAPFDAARLGVYLHGLAGESVRERIGDAGLLASDLPEPIAAGAAAAGRDRRTRAEVGRPARASRDRDDGEDGPAGA